MVNKKLELEKQYRETIYSVYMDKEIQNIKIEKSLPPVINNVLNQEKTAAILTAWNPRSQQLSLDVNKKRNKQLKKQLKKFVIFDAAGKGLEQEERNAQWHAEESYFILGIKQKEAENLAVKYEQNAYIWLENEEPASLIFTEIW